jgi:hypothetical protein
VLRLMDEHQVRLLPVLDGGALIGVISLGDIIKVRISASVSAGQFRRLVFTSASREPAAPAGDNAAIVAVKPHLIGAFVKKVQRANPNAARWSTQTQGIPCSNRLTVREGKVVISRRERIVMLEPFDKGLMATTFRYAYEVRNNTTFPRRLAEVRAVAIRDEEGCRAVQATNT